MKSKITVLAIMACCAMLAVSCNNQPKTEEVVEEEVIEEVVVDSTAVAPADSTAAPVAE